MATAVTKIQEPMAKGGLRLQDVIDRAEMNLHELHLKTKISYQTLLRYRDNENVSIKTKHVILICKVTKQDANTLFGIKPDSL